MNSEPFFSICIPAFNASKTIQNAILSFTKQEAYFSYEILVIDDGSSDNTSNIVQSFCEKDCRVKLFIQENQGICYTRYRLMSLATGKYVLFCDADDTYEDGSLNILYNALSENKYDILFYGYNSITINKKGMNEIIKYPISVISKNDAISFLLQGSIPNSVWTKAIRRKCLPIDYPFEPFYSIRNSEDRLISYLSILRAEKIGCLKECLYNYFANPESITHVPNPKRYKEYFLVEDAILKDLRNRKADETSISMFANGNLRSCVLRSITEILRCNISWREKLVYYHDIRKTPVVDELYRYIGLKGMKIKHKLLFVAYRLLMIWR